MKGVQKLKVPVVLKKPSLFIITLLKDSEKSTHSIVEFTLEDAISKIFNKETCSRDFSIANYITHVKLSVDEINRLFKNFTL